MKHHLFVGIALGIAAVHGSACALNAEDSRAEGAFTRTLRVSGPVDLDVRTGSGDIRIHTGSAGTVEVRGRVRSWVGWHALSGLSAQEQVRRVEADPPIEQSGNAVRLGSTWRSWKWQDVSISYDVTVPPDTQVRARSGSGAQEVDGVDGPVDASAGSGSIRISRIHSNVRAVAGSGAVEVEDSDGGAMARTGSGAIRARAVKGNIEARTGSGRVSVAQARGTVGVSTGSGDIRVSDARGPLRLRAASGSVTVDGEPTADWTLSAASGSITLSVPSDAGFDLDARTSSGGIHSVHPISVVGSLSRRELHGQVRGGGPSVDVSTASGAIRIR